MRYFGMLRMTNWNSGLLRHPQLENISLQRNMKDRKFSIAKRLRSFKFALEGLKTVLREEHNARIHFGIAFFVIVFGLILHINVLEWLFLVIAIGFVIASEIINSAIEHIADFIHPDKNDKIKIIKDISASAVLIASITALVVGLFIFLLKII